MRTQCIGLMRTGVFITKPLGKMTKADLLAAADYERRKAEGRSLLARSPQLQEMFDALLKAGFRPAPDNPDNWRRVTKAQR